MYFVYVLYSPAFDRPYTGQTDNVEKRLVRHNAKKVAATKAYAPWEFVEQEKYKTRGEAMRRERWLKTGIGREFVKQLIASHKLQNG